MKKLTTTILLSFVFLNINSQFNIGINGTAGVSKNKISNLNRLAFGFNSSIGYSFNRKLEINGSFTKLIFDQSYSANCYSIETKYLFFNYTYLKPFLGIGLSHCDFKSTTFSEHYTYSYGYYPTIGLLIDTDLIKGLYVNIDYKYFKTIPYKENEREYSTIISNLFSIGLKYYFVKKTTTK